MKLRPEVQAFAEMMEAKLQENAHKGGWKGCTTAYLSRRCGNELEELRSVVQRLHAWMRDNTFPSGRGPSLTDNADLSAEIGREAADVANFAMMLADVCGALVRQKEAA